MSALLDSNTWEERRHDVAMIQRDQRQEFEYHDRMSRFEDGSETLCDVMTPDECVDLVGECEALVVEAIKKKLPLPDVGGIILDMFREKWDLEAQRFADDVE